MKHNELRNLSIGEAERLIRTKELSPVALTEAYFERIDQVEDKLNAYVHLYKKEALQVAGALEAMQSAGHFLGPLHGIPIAIKDNISMAGFHASAGAKLRQDYIPTEDATVVARLKAAGAIIVGHTNMHEFALGATTDNPHYGVSRNPWDPTRFCAGSSGGSGCTVAAGGVPAALGTDTGGSVRLPAAINGLVGIRPTIGRVSNNGIVPCGWSMDTCGPLTRTVEDNAIMLSVMAGYDPLDSSTSEAHVGDYFSSLEAGVKNMRIGVLPEYMYEFSQPDVTNAVKAAIEVFRSLGAEIVEYPFENMDMDAIKSSFSFINCAEASAYHQKDIREHAKDYGADIRLMNMSYEFLPANAYLQAQRFRWVLHEEFKRAFETVDFFVYPTIPYTAVEIGNYGGRFFDLTTNYTAIASLTGFPALSVPCGLDHNGLPIGMQMLGKAFQEGALYRAAKAFEQKVNLFDKLPAFVEG